MGRHGEPIAFRPLRYWSGLGPAEQPVGRTVGFRGTRSGISWDGKSWAICGPLAPESAKSESLFGQYPCFLLNSAAVLWNKARTWLVDKSVDEILWEIVGKIRHEI